jgi:hypothetical protein
LELLRHHHSNRNQFTVWRVGDRGDGAAMTLQFAHFGQTGTAIVDAEDVHQTLFAADRSLIYIVDHFDQHLGKKMAIESVPLCRHARWRQQMVSNQG